MQIRLRNVLAIGALTSGLLAGGALVANAATTSSTTGDSGTGSTSSSSRLQLLDDHPVDELEQRELRLERRQLGLVEHVPGVHVGSGSTHNCPNMGSGSGTHTGTPPAGYGTPPSGSSSGAPGSHSRPGRLTSPPPKRGRAVRPYRHADRTAPPPDAARTRRQESGRRPLGVQRGTPPAPPARRRCRRPGRPIRAAAGGRPAARSRPGPNTRTPSR